MVKDDSKIFKLNVKNRFAIMNILPKESNYVTIRLISGLGKKLDLTKEEIKKFGVVGNPSGGISWNTKLEGKPKEIRVDNILIGIIIEELNKLEKAKKITEETANLYEMFVQAKEEKQE